MLLQEFNFKKEVLESAEPVLVDFWAPWCGPCRTMNPILEAVARDYKVCKVNTESNPQLAQRFGITAIPTLLIFKGGQIVARRTGVTPEATLRDEMARLR